MVVSETYTMTSSDTDSIPISYGTYSDIVARKHVSDYGGAGQSNIRRAVHSVFGDALKQVGDQTKSNNVLLVGKVQSGKTSNLEALTALAFDNGFNLMIVYGGYDTKLLAQTTERFKKTFDVSDDEEDIFEEGSPAVFTTGNGGLSVSDIDNVTLENLIGDGIPIIITAMKRPPALKLVNEFLSRVDRSLLNCLVIDDEGDQASLNIEKDKENDASATYACICQMKDLLVDPLYFSVTATPQANIFLNSISRLRPDSIHLLYPGKGYCGADSYRPDSGSVIIVEDEMDDAIESGTLPKSLRSAINYFIVASTIMQAQSIKKSDMIIHAYRETEKHKQIYHWVNTYLEQLAGVFDQGDEVGKRACLKQLKESYKRCASDDDQADTRFGDIATLIPKVIRNCYVVLQNSAGAETQGGAKLHKHVIYIGGDLLQRGLTFKGLVATYFTRWPKDGGNMDTNLQRARWFGYRNSYIDLCRVFTSDSISDELYSLAEADDDLWDQFEEIEAGSKNIRDVVIRADSTQQRPTRRQAAEYEVVHFTSNWIKQRQGVFDVIENNSNRTAVESFLSTIEFEKSNLGSKTGNKDTCLVGESNAATVKELFSSLAGIFDESRFRASDISRILAGEESKASSMSVICMNKFEGEGRFRSFYDSPNMQCVIKALHQGADSYVPEKVDYMGDKYVIADRSTINLQIFKITSKHDAGSNPGLTQYMFALYVPGDRSYFVPSWV